MKKSSNFDLTSLRTWSRLFLMDLASSSVEARAVSVKDRRRCRRSRDRRLILTLIFLETGTSLLTSSLIVHRWTH